MENLPKFEVIGNVPEEEKDKYKITREDLFLKQEDVLPEEKRKEIESVELEKTPEQIAILNFVNSETNRLIEESGLETFDVPLKNYHILSIPDLKRFLGAESPGVYKSNSYSIGLSDEQCSNFSDFALVAFHETLHMKSRNIWQLYSDKEGKIRPNEYRFGVRVFSPHKKYEDDRGVTHFSGLDEAIVSWQEKMSFPRLLDIPVLREEKQFYKQGKKLRQKIAKEDEISEDEIYRVSILNDKEYFRMPYFKPRMVLEYVCEEISKEFDEEYKTKEDVFRVFFRANFDGNLIPIARLMKQTFGDNGLRVLGMMKPKGDNASINNISEMLIKMRRDILNGKK